MHEKVLFNPQRNFQLVIINAFSPNFHRYRLSSWDLDSCYNFFHFFIKWPISHPYLHCRIIKQLLSPIWSQSYSAFARVLPKKYEIMRLFGSANYDSTGKVPYRLWCGHVARLSAEDRAHIGSCLVVIPGGLDYAEGPPACFVVASCGVLSL